MLQKIKIKEGEEKISFVPELLSRVIQQHSQETSDRDQQNSSAISNSGITAWDTLSDIQCGQQKSNTVVEWQIDQESEETYTTDKIFGIDQNIDNDNYGYNNMHGQSSDSMQRNNDQEEDDGYSMVMAENCQWNGIEAVIAIVNHSDNLNITSIKNIFNGGFEVYDWCIVQFEIRNIIGITKQYELRLRPLDNYMPNQLSYDDFKSHIINFWQKQLEPLDESRFWLRFLEESQKSRLLKGKTLKASCCGMYIGCFLDHSTMVVRGMICCSPLLLHMDFGKREISIRIEDMYLIEFNAKELQDFVIVDTMGEKNSIFLTLKHPPRIFDISASNSNDDIDNKFRITNIGNIPSEVFGHCFTIMLFFEKPNPKMLQLRDQKLSNILDMLAAVGKEIFYAHINIANPVCPLPSVREGICKKTIHCNSWEVTLAWLCVASSPGFVCDRFGEEFFKLLDEYPEDMVAKGLYNMVPILQLNLFASPTEVFMESLTKARKIGADRNFEDSQIHCFLPRLIITPTRLLFFEPDIIQTNQVIRTYAAQARFLRVTVRDENIGRLSSIKGKISKVLDRIEDILNNEIYVGESSFKYLGSSNSQRRDHACYFVDESNEKDLAESIRDWVGNLSNIKNVAKYVSRIGQVFSTSVHAINIDASEYKVIADIERNGYCFTEGIGIISSDLAEQINEYIGGSVSTPCAFQIRLGGSKGVVAVDPNVHDKYPGKRILIRESMRKYASNHTAIEVLSTYARPQELYLNQQLIVLLSHLNIPDEVFYNLMQYTLNCLCKMFIDEETAYNEIKGILCGIDWDLLKESNFGITTEPYLRSMLMALYRVRMQELKEKSRIPIDSSKARMLLGTVDESRSLSYGQVFIQISPNIAFPGVDKKILNCRVCVSKSPCLHPGDVRTFNAVDCVSLHHMYDCIVFPSTGPRPHPNEMSGSDLDGDVYHVIWDEELVPTCPNKQAMNYKALPEKRVEGEITPNLMIKFIRESIEYDCLGQIDNTHKALSDFLGIENDSCILLSALHSQAVDAPKNGNWASVPSKVRRQLIKYPDFMMKQDKPSYPSEKILGKMYRLCNKYLSVCNIRSGVFGHFEREAMRFLVEGHEDFLEEARILRSEYNHQIEKIMNMYGVITEAEIMSGFIEKHHQKIGKEKIELKELSCKLRLGIIEKYRAKFFKDERINYYGIINEERAMQKASAWYMATYSPKEIVEKYLIGSQGVPFLSFPWVISDYLIKIFKKNENAYSNPKSNPETRINESAFDYWKICIPKLINRFEERLLLRDSINNMINEQGYYVMLYGMSYTCLFDEHSFGTDLFLWYNETESYIKLKRQMDSLTQRNVLSSVKDTIQNYCDYCKLIKMGSSTRLSFKIFDKNLQKIAKGHIAISPLLLLQSAVLLEYIYWFPWLLPFLKIIVKWAQATGIIGYNHNSLIDFHIICFIAINNCLNKGYLDSVDVDSVMEWMKNGDYEVYCCLETWHQIFKNIPMHLENFPPLGGVILDFYQSAQQTIKLPIFENLAKILGGNFFHEILSPESLILFEEETQRAFHKISFHCDVVPLFRKVESEKILFLGMETAHSMIGSEQFYTRLLTKQSGCEVEIHLKAAKQRNPGFLIKVLGSSTSIRSAERLLEYFKNRATVMSKIEDDYPGPMELWFYDSHKIIVEGIGGDDDKVILEDYYGPRHPKHDNRGLYVLNVVESSVAIPRKLDDQTCQEYAIFYNHFVTCYTKLLDNRIYSQFIHGPKIFTIKFGRLYIMNPRATYTENPEGTCVSQILNVLENSPRHNVSNPYIWSAHLKSHKGLTQEKSYIKIGNQMQSAFYPRMMPNVSKSQLTQLVQNLGYAQSAIYEGYELSLHGKSSGVTGQFDTDLALHGACCSPIYCMVVDLKKRYNGNNECDVRFEICTKQKCSVDETRKLENCLYWPSFCNCSFPYVKPNVLKRAESLRHYKRKEYVSNSTNIKMYVTDYKVFSRQNKICKNFSWRESLIDLTIVINTNDFDSIMPTNLYIAYIWKLAIIVAEQKSF